MHIYDFVYRGHKNVKMHTMISLARPRILRYPPCNENMLELNETNDCWRKSDEHIVIIDLIFILIHHNGSKKIK